jgi:hypothetical protein
VEQTTVKGAAPKPSVTAAAAKPPVPAKRASLTKLSDGGSGGGNGGGGLQGSGEGVGPKRTSRVAADSGLTASGSSDPAFKTSMVAPGSRPHTLQYANPYSSSSSSVDSGLGSSFVHTLSYPGSDEPSGKDKNTVFLSTEMGGKSVYTSAEREEQSLYSSGNSGSGHMGSRVYSPAPYNPSSSSAPTSPSKSPISGMSGGAMAGVAAGAVGLAAAGAAAAYGVQRRRASSKQASSQAEGDKCVVC